MPRTGCSLIINVFLQIIQSKTGVGGEEGVGRMEKEGAKRKEKNAENINFALLKFIVIIIATIFKNFLRARDCKRCLAYFKSHKHT